MAPTAVRMALVEGEDADGVIVEEDSFRLARDTASTCASDRVIAAILGTREGAADAGLRLSSIGVSWTDQIQAAALRDALAARKVENVMLVSAFLAAVAMGQAVGGSVGYERTGVLFVEPDSATLAVVATADGSLCDVRRLQLAADDDTAIAELAELVAGADTMRARPDGFFVIGAGVDVPLIKPALDAATSLTVSVPEEHEMALARGAALASGNSPLFASTTAALAYAQDPAGSEETGVNDLAFSAELDEDTETPEKRRPSLLVGSGLAVVGIAAVIALEVALAINIRPTMVALQPKPSENRFIAPAAQAPVPAAVAAPQHKIDLPGPASVPRATLRSCLLRFRWRRPLRLPRLRFPWRPSCPGCLTRLPPLRCFLSSFRPFRLRAPKTCCGRRWFRLRCSCRASNPRCLHLARRFRLRRRVSRIRSHKRLSSRTRQGWARHRCRAGVPSVAVVPVAVVPVAGRAAAALADRAPSAGVTASPVDMGRSVVVDPVRRVPSAAVAPVVADPVRRVPSAAVAPVVADLVRRVPSAAVAPVAASAAVAVGAVPSVVAAAAPVAASVAVAARPVAASVVVARAAASAAVGMVPLAAGAVAAAASAAAVTVAAAAGFGGGGGGHGHR